MKTQLVQCHISTLPAIDLSGAELPADIQYMPPGVNYVTPASGGGKKLKINVHAGTAERLQASLEMMKAKADAGEDNLPFLDFEHRDGEASGHPTRFFWGGDDKKKGGVRLALDWTSDGGDKVKGKVFTKFSPQFLHNAQTGEVVGAPVNMGGLVNRAAFKNIAPVLGKDGTQTQHENMETETDQAELIAAKDQEIASLQKKVTDLTAKTSEIETLNGKIKRLEDAATVQAKEIATDYVKTHGVAAGRIPPADAALIKHCEDLYLTNPVACKAMIERMQVNPALATVVPNGAGGSAVQAKAGEDPFLVKAKEFGDARKITDPMKAQAEFAQTSAGNVLYQAYVQKMRGGK
ncbi:MAG TPA: phage protease [Verrucomicrobiae bacterium]|jgi:hypothetical protein|nr:phage protease [Verrucomicrobiae bacterium]